MPCTIPVGSSGATSTALVSFNISRTDGMSAAMMGVLLAMYSKIFIGENICITVVDIDRGKIRLGIEAPRDVPIYRQEILEGRRAALEGFAVGVYQVGAVVTAAGKSVAPCASTGAGFSLAAR